jgi:hypothetical protein
VHVAGTVRADGSQFCVRCELQLNEPGSIVPWELGELITVWRDGKSQRIGSMAGAKICDPAPKD